MSDAKAQFAAWFCNNYEAGNDASAVWDKALELAGVTALREQVSRLEEERDDAKAIANGATRAAITNASLVTARDEELRRVREACDEAHKLITKVHHPLPENPERCSICKAEAILLAAITTPPPHSGEPSMNIPGQQVSHQIITHECRTNRGDDGALNEALSRIREAYWTLVDRGLVPQAELHLALIVQMDRHRQPPAPRHPHQRRILMPQYPDLTPPPEGLYMRYVVEKADGSPVDPRAFYFVLRLDDHGDDQTWIECCRVAAHALVDALRERGHLPKVADDLESRLPAAAPRTLIGDGQPLPRIVCLCGSTRFYKAFQEANYRETMAGRIVLSVGFYPHAETEAHGEERGCTPEQKIALDELHKRKIDLADEVLVLNVNGYIGDSTRSEINYALKHGKPVRYWDCPSRRGSHRDLPSEPAASSSPAGAELPDEPGVWKRRGAKYDIEDLGDGLYCTAAYRFSPNASPAILGPVEKLPRGSWHKATPPAEIDRLRTELAAAQRERDAARRDRNILLRWISAAERIAKAAGYEHAERECDPDYFAERAVERVNSLRQQVERLREALTELKLFAEAHHGDQPPHVLLHGLTIDIPAMCDDQKLIERLSRLVSQRAVSPSDVDWLLLHLPQLLALARKGLGAEKASYALKIVAAGIWRDKERNACGLAGAAVAVHAVEEALAALESALAKQEPPRA